MEAAVGNILGAAYVSEWCCNFHRSLLDVLNLGLLNVDQQPSAVIGQWVVVDFAMSVVLHMSQELAGRNQPGIAECNPPAEELHTSLVRAE